MAWLTILWVIFLIMSITLVALNFYQFLGFSDLESDYMNPYELSSRINYVILPEYLLHGAFCILLLVTGHWLMFLLLLPPAYYNLKQYAILSSLSIFSQFIAPASFHYGVVFTSLYTLLIVPCFDQPIKCDLVDAGPNAEKLHPYIKRQHLIDVTEVFRVLNAEKKARLVKLGFYVILFGIAMTRLIFSILNAVFDGDDDAIRWYWFGLR